MADALAAFTALSVDDQRILQVLSVICEPIAPDRLRQILDALDWRDQAGSPLSRRVDDTLHKRLVAAGQIKAERGTFACRPDLLEPRTRETLAEGTFESIVAAAERVIPAVPPKAPTWLVPSPERRLRLLRVALYAGRQDEALRMFALSDQVSLSGLSAAHVMPLTQLLTSSTALAWLDGLDPRLKIAGLVPPLRLAARDMIDRAGAYALMEQLFTPLAGTHPEAADALIEQRLQRGRLAEVQPLLDGRSDPAALVQRGWLQFLLGNYEQALDDFDAARETIRKTTRKRKVYLPGIPGVLALLTRLRRGEREDFEFVQQQVAICLRADVSDPVEPVYRLLGELATVLSGQRRVDECAWLDQRLGLRGAFVLLLQSLMLHWLGERPAPEALDVLAGWAAKANQAGYLWYAHEASALLNAFGFQGERPQLGRPPVGLVSMTDLLARKATWEIALDALKGLATQTAPGGVETSAGTDRRMAWQLGFIKTHGMLEPREQKRMKRGGWTSGRAVSLQKLVEEPESFGYLTPQDREICACIVREQGTTWYGGSDRLSYRFDADRALLAAVGHPLLTVRRQGGNGVTELPLELVLGDPVLSVVRRHRDILVTIEPFPPEGRALLPVDETSKRIRLVRFEPTHRDIARILGPEGLKVPEGAEARLLEGLAAVAPMVTVHSDIVGDDSATETMAADARPHLHLSPFAAGLTLELRMHPFGDSALQLLPGQGRATLLTEIEGRAVRCTRDLEGERTAAREVLDACPALRDNESWSWSLDDLEVALTALEQLHALGEAVVLDWPEGKRIGLTAEMQMAQLRVKIEQEGDWLDLQGEIRLDSGRILLMQELLDLAAAAKGRFIPLGERDFLVLSQALRRKLDGLRGLTDKGRFHPLAAPAIAEAIDGMTLDADKAWQALLDRLAAVEELEPEIPSTLQAELRDYQIEGYRWLARLAHWGAGACLADDMGLGKTLQALALILSRAPKGPTLVLAPTSVCSNWVDEAQRFAPTLQPCRFGSGDRAAMLDAAGPFDLIICSYGLLQTEGERLAAVSWETIVADEAQSFKNALTKRSQAMMRLKGDFRLITTGTPVENHLGELWNLSRFINPGLLGSLETFNRRFAIPIEQNRDAGARHRLRQLLRPFILRRLKSEVLSELPPRTEITLRLELSDGELALYEAMRRQAVERLSGPEAAANPGQQRIQLLAEIMRLRRACCHPRLALPDSDLSSAKLDAFNEILDELLENRHKALVFSQFVDHLSLIRAHLDARGIRYQYLDGSTPEPQRRAAVAAFQAGEGELFLISLRAGGVGLNLTAADYVIHMDPWWNPAVEDQASDRAHRIGQQRPVTVYRLVAKETIEERILALHAAKRDLADGLLEGSEGGGRLSYADMLALVRG
jgi:superfamily II DNA or RNA helicase